MVTLLSPIKNNYIHSYLYTLAIIRATNGLAARKAYAQFLGKWSKLCPPVARSLEDAGERQQWLDSFANNYEPNWRARLWPIRKAILTEDIDPVQDPETGEIVQDGVNYLLYRLKNAYWFKSYEESVGGPRGDRRVGTLGKPPSDLRRISAPRDWGGRNLDLEAGRSLDEVIRH